MSQRNLVEVDAATQVVDGATFGQFGGVALGDSLVQQLLGVFTGEGDGEERGAVLLGRNNRQDLLAKCRCAVEESTVVAAGNDESVECLSLLGGDLGGGDSLNLGGLRECTQIFCQPGGVLFGVAVGGAEDNQHASSHL